MGEFSYYKVGLGNVGSYQVSGYPYVTGSATLNSGAEDQVIFPSVVKSFTVINRADVTIRVHFNGQNTGNTAAGKHYITLENTADSATFNIKCKEVYISSTGNGAAYELFAELTRIPTKEMPPLTGSGLTD
jgi:hypothetical protein